MVSEQARPVGRCGPGYRRKLIPLLIVVWKSRWPERIAVTTSARDFGLAVTLEQRQQTPAHQHSRPVRRHVHLDLAIDVDDGIGVGGLQDLAILLDDGGIPGDKFLSRGKHPSPHLR